MRKYDRVSFGVWEIEASAQCVTELVVERHSYSTETGCTEPGAVLSFQPRFQIRRVVDDDGQ